MYREWNEIKWEKREREEKKIHTKAEWRSHEKRVDIRIKIGAFGILLNHV